MNLQFLSKYANTNLDENYFFKNASIDLQDHFDEIAATVAIDWATGKGI